MRSLLAGGGAQPACSTRPGAAQLRRVQPAGVSLLRGPAQKLQLQRRLQVNTAAAGPGFASASGPLLCATFRANGSKPGAGSSSSSALNAAAADGGAAKPAKASKPRLPSLDSLRFFLIAYIGVGHFVAFATKDAFLLKLFSQVNVWVGPFFVLSGYVAAYTATELGKYAASPRVAPAWAYTVARVAGYYPLFILVQLLFAPMFIFADNAYNGALATAAHGLMGVTLTQAWFPAHAEIWNAPTWFLSALTFAMLVLPHVLPAIAAMRKKGLKLLLLGLTLVSVVGKLAYSYDLGAWGFLEGVMSARSHPNILFWNITRFNPFYCLLEVLMGVAAARLVMVESVDDDGKPLDSKPAPAGSVALPILGLLGITAARAAGWLQLNDPLTRALLFVPLFTLLVVRLHRNTLAGSPGLTGVLSLPLLTYLGSISFPIFVLHGALGQLFYKKIVATKVWGSVMPLSFFPAYCGIVLLFAAVVQKFFVENKKVQEISGNITKSISAAF